MRQAGFMAAAGLYALQNNFKRLEEDHLHAKQIADALRQKEFISEVLPVETNIIIFHLKAGQNAKDLVAKLKEKGILGYAIGPASVRLVVHLDITEEMVIRTIDVISKL